MKSRKVTKTKLVEPEKQPHKVTGDTITKAMRSARIPLRFAKTAVTLTGFTWGKRLLGWINGVLLENIATGRGFFLASEEEDAMDTSAMLARTLVLRGFDAVWVSLDDLMHDAEALRSCEFLIIAGFYSRSLDKSIGSPMTAAQSHALSWKLWRMANDGVTIIANVSPSYTEAERWWANGALASIFDKQQSINLKKAAI